jgi:hypothetical protein
MLISAITKLRRKKKKYLIWYAAQCMDGCQYSSLKCVKELRIFLKINRKRNPGSD